MHMKIIEKYSDVRYNVRISNSTTMRAKSIISISEARKDIFKIAQEVQKPDTYYTLTENGRAKAVIMSAEEFESWQETIEIMADSQLMKEISEADKEFKQGKFIELENLTNKNVSSNIKGKSSKKSK